MREQFNRAENLDSDRRRGNIGFALTVLQRRLASSTAAIAASLTRRRERLEKRLQELNSAGPRTLDQTVELEDLDDVEDLPDEEADVLVERVVDQATAARTADELCAEIAILKGLEALAQRVRRDPESDRKWRELRISWATTLSCWMLKAAGASSSSSPSIAIRSITSLPDCGRCAGDPRSVVVIHGGIHREARKDAENAFRNDPDVEVLVATDAAGEGINLQRAHLMANYDLPWNPNRIEQRFGRIHRIGQSGRCATYGTSSRMIRAKVKYS